MAWKQQKGMTIVYWGDGKGKTTAAMGVAVRALGNGWNVYIAQFMKSEEWPSGERDFFQLGWGTSFPPPNSPPPPQKPLDSFVASERAKPYGPLAPSSSSLATNGGCVVFETLGQGFVGIMGDKKPREMHLRAATEAYDTVHSVLVAGQHQLIVLDEILSALDEDLLTEDQILALMRDRPEQITLVMTGHKAYDRILAVADLVTEMKKIKHPFDGGSIAMKGIDY